MSSMVPRDLEVIEWGAAGAPIAGEEESGDLQVIAPFSDGVLVGLIDGLGHGPEAAHAAREAARVLEAHAGEPVVALVARCHDAIHKTRGVVLSLASFDTLASSMTWVGVGNVEGVLVRESSATSSRKREAIVERGGVVGYQLPPLRAATYPVAKGDVVILTTDGIRSEYIDDLQVAKAPRDLAEDILTRYARGTDDALVLVVRYVGRAP